MITPGKDLIDGLLEGSALERHGDRLFVHVDKLVMSHDGLRAYWKGKELLYLHCQSHINPKTDSLEVDLDAVLFPFSLDN